jgi:hypothetical protein
VFHYPKSSPPEPYASAALYLLYRVALFIRNHADTISHEQVFDIGEAIHNVPISLTEYGDYFDEQKIRDFYLAVYDKKWVKVPHDFSLIQMLDAGTARAKEWLAKS